MASSRGVEKFLGIWLWLCRVRQLFAMQQRVGGGVVGGSDNSSCYDAGNFCLLFALALLTAARMLAEELNLVYGRGLCASAPASDRSMRHSPANVISTSKAASGQVVLQMVVVAAE